MSASSLRDRLAFARRTLRYATGQASIASSWLVDNALTFTLATALLSAVLGFAPLVATSGTLLLAPFASQAASGLVVLLPPRMYTALQATGITSASGTWWLICITYLMAVLIGVAYYIVRNSPVEARLELAVRARRFDDRRIIELIARRMRRAVIRTCGTSRPHPPIRNHADLSIEQVFARSRARSCDVLLDHAAAHFRCRRAALEAVFGVSSEALTSRTLRRLELRQRADVSLMHKIPILIPAIDERDATDIDDCAVRLISRLEKLHRHSRDVARVLRSVISEPSSSRAVQNAADLLEDISTKDHERQELVQELLDLRHGVPLTTLLWSGVREHPDPPCTQDDLDTARRSFLKRMPAISAIAEKEVATAAAAYLSRRIESGVKVIVTVGLSRVVAAAIRALAAKRVAGKTAVGFVVWVVLPRDRGSEGEHLRSDQALMKAELLREPTLEGRVSRVRLEELADARLDLRESAVLLLGAEAISLSGLVIHPRGRLDVHRDLSALLASPPDWERCPPPSGKAEQPRRLVVASPNKILDDDKVESWRSYKLLTCFVPQIDYDAVICDRFSDASHVRDRLIDARSAWRRAVSMELALPTPEHLWKGGSSDAC